MNPYPKYEVGTKVAIGTIIAYEPKRYTIECDKCGNHLIRGVTFVNFKRCICRLDYQTIKIKDKIAYILEMYFGLGIQIPEIGKIVKLESSSVSWLISRHGFKKREGITIKLKSKV